MSEPVLDWDRIIHKNVRSQDMGDLGNVIATDGESITLMRGIHEFKIPKSSVEGYNGSEVFLNITEAEIYNYKA